MTTTTKKLVTKSFHIENAKEFISSIANTDDVYYVFTGNHIPYEPDDSSISTPVDSIQNSLLDVYNNMQFGKRVAAADVAHMIPRIEWESNTVYSEYDHANTDLYDSNFYAMVSSPALHHVYKCLYNNNDTPSTYAPMGTDTDPIVTEDGYIWKYMYTVTEAEFSKFKSVSYMPVIANASVQAAAVPGAIEVIHVDDSGLRYNNFFNSQFRFEDIKIDGFNNIYGLDESASALDNFYQNCIIKITSGTAEGEYRIIRDYRVEDSKKKIYIDSPFTNTPEPSDTFEIQPFVFIYGDGYETSNAIARAIVNANNGNSISRVEVLDPGSGYRYAQAVFINPTVVTSGENFAEAELRPIISPPGGHGYDPIHELGANRVGISVKFANNEANNIPASNDYRQVGLIKNPLFSNVTIQIETSNTIGGFLVDEYVYQVKDIVLAGTVAVNTNSAAVVGTNTFFDTSFSVGDYVFITSGSDNYFGTVSGITDNTHLTVSSNILWTGSGAQISKIEKLTQGRVTATTVGSITLADLDVAKASDDTRLIGNTSFASSYIDLTAPFPTIINDKPKNNNYETFVELNKLVGEPISTLFDLDEEVIQDSAVSYSQPSARVHSVVSNPSDNDVMFVSNMRNVFMSNTDVVGVDSGRSFKMLNKYLGDLVKDSGEVVYIENVAPITRDDNKSEIIKLIIEL